MTLRAEKIFSLVWVSLGVFLFFEALVYILNLDQPGIYLNLSLAMAAYLTFKIAFFYDLHFKSTGVYGCKETHTDLFAWLWCRVQLVVRYAAQRLIHFRHWKTLRQWIHCMGIPTLLYWATVGIIFLNFQRILVQQVFVLFSTVAFALFFWHIKEIYRNKAEELTETVQISLQAIKLYSAFTIFIAALGLVQYFCLSYWSLCLVVLGSIFTLMYQSLFHMQKIKVKAVGSIFVIAVIMALFSGLVYTYWGLSYTTGALFLMGIYNFFWGIYSYFLRGRLSWAVFWEYFLVTLLICGMSVGITNFRARIIPYC